MNIFKIPDKVEDQIRHALSKYPVLYALVGGIAIVLFWRGVWHLADDFQLTSGASFVISIILMLLTGTFVSFFIGDQLIISGLKAAKRLDQRTEREIQEEEEKIQKLHNTVQEMNQDLKALKRMMEERERGAALPVVLLIIALIAIAGFVFMANQSDKEMSVVSPSPSPTVVYSPTPTVSSNDSTEPQLQGELLAGQKSQLLDFNSGDYNAILNTDKLIVLYFYANWCPICRAEFPKMQSAFNELENENVIGFRVNFNDNETDDYEKSLARQFGVAYQHTKVFVRNGQRILKSPESWEKDRYLSEINAAFK